VVSTQSTPTALKRTKKSIAESGQQVYGYVLDDGRIVDGNRRFTALRDIHQSTGKTVYFEAVVLPFSYNNTTERVKIKKLELAIQMGVEERQSYDPVDSSC
jgi:ParB-like chromosome segregation protein Spo0J